MRRRDAESTRFHLLLCLVRVRFWTVGGRAGREPVVAARLIYGIYQLMNGIAKCENNAFPISAAYEHRIADKEEAGDGGEVNCHTRSRSSSTHTRFDSYRLALLALSSRPRSSRSCTQVFVTHRHLILADSAIWSSLAATRPN